MGIIHLNLKEMENKFKSSIVIGVAIIITAFILGQSLKKGMKILILFL